MLRFNSLKDAMADGKTAVQALQAIWENHYGDSLDSTIAPLIQEQIGENVVVFLSLSPSLATKLDTTAQKGSKPEIYPMINCEGIRRHPHYEKFFVVGKQLKEAWTAVHLLALRNTNQEEVEQLPADFLKAQIQFTFAILNAIQPKLVIVADAATDKLINTYYEELGLSIEIPSPENDCIHSIAGIPFLMRESKFIGSRQHWTKQEKRELMFKEAKRILSKLYPL
jgi:hypothetical protein